MQHKYSEDGFCLKCGISLVRAEFHAIECNNGDTLVGATHRFAKKAGTEVMKMLEAKNAAR